MSLVFEEPSPHYSDGGEDPKKFEVVVARYAGGEVVEAFLREG
jgi:hypothetical protein